MGKVLFLHPDLGIGGAERLVVDAALALRNGGHVVTFVTSHHDPKHCFVETRDGTLPVIIAGDWIPRSFLGKFYALCAYIRMIYTTLYVLLFSKLEYDVVICDQVSVGIPLLKAFGRKVLFYCHFPDQLLSKEGTPFKSIYRLPLNWLEERTTGMADMILVNSKFTLKVFQETFKHISVVPDILYPSINTKSFDTIYPPPLHEVIQPHNLAADSLIFLSINRYERKKNLILALEALGQLKSMLDENDWKKIYLIMAGGYDPRVNENVEHFTELMELAAELDISEKVIFLKSPSDPRKLSLLTHCHCVIYTPANEHFGIVPLEAMYMNKPVIAANSGGPTETIEDGVTGFLCEIEPNYFAVAMAKCISNERLRNNLGREGKKRMMEKFSFQAFSNQLENIVSGLMSDTKIN